MKLIYYKIGNSCYSINVGDSRSVLSMEKGSKFCPLTEDHKPELETERINKNGGYVYQNKNSILSHTKNILTTPFRVFPGRLSVFYNKKEKNIKFNYFL